MRPDVGRVLVLVDHDIARAAGTGRQRPGQGDGAIPGMVDRAHVIGRGPHLGPQHPQQDPLLLRHPVGNRHGETEPVQGGQRRQGDGGVAGGGFDELAAVEIGEEVPEHVGGGSILDGAERVEPFQLEVQVESRLGHHPFDPHERGGVVGSG